MYCMDKGYVCSFRKVKADHEKGALVARRGGGFAVGTEDQGAAINLRRRTERGGTADAPAVAEKPEGVQAKAAEEARLKKLQADMLERRAEREAGKWVPRDEVERELSMRARAFRYALESWIYDVAGELADVYCGSPEGSRAALAEALGMDADEVSGEAAKALARFVHARMPDAVAVFQRGVETMLEPFASGEWWTEEMAERFKGAA
jgi:hypothetical protein